MSTLFANKYYQQLFENGSDASTLQDQDMSTEGTDMRLQRIFGGRQDEEESSQADFTENTEERLQRIFGGGDSSTGTGTTSQLQEMFGGNDEEDEEDYSEYSDSDLDSESTMEMDGGAKWKKGSKRARAHMAKIRAMQKHPLVKGSPEAKARMAAIRALRKFAKPAAATSDVSSVATSEATSVTANSEMMAAEFMKQSAKNSVEVAQKALNFVKGLQPDYPNKVANVKKAQAVFDTEKAKYNTILQENTGQKILKQQRNARTVQEKDIESAFLSAKVAYDVVKNSATASTVDKAVAKKRLEVAKEQYNEYHFLKSSEKNYDTFLESLPASAKVFPMYMSKTNSNKNPNGTYTDPRKHNAYELHAKFEGLKVHKVDFQAHLNKLKTAQANLDYQMALPDTDNKERMVKDAEKALEAAQKAYDEFLESHDQKIKTAELQAVIKDAGLYKNYIEKRSKYAGQASNKNTAEKNLKTAEEALKKYTDSLKEKKNWEKSLQKSQAVQAAKKRMDNAWAEYGRADGEDKVKAQQKLTAAMANLTRVESAANMTTPAAALAAPAGPPAAAAAPGLFSWRPTARTNPTAPTALNAQTPTAPPAGFSLFTNPISSYNPLPLLGKGFSRGLQAVGIMSTPESPVNAAKRAQANANAKAKANAKTKANANAKMAQQQRIFDEVANKVSTAFEELEAAGRNGRDSQLDLYLNKRAEIYGNLTKMFVQRNLLENDENRALYDNLSKNYEIYEAWMNNKLAEIEAAQAAQAAQAAWAPPAPEAPAPAPSAPPAPAPAPAPPLVAPGKNASEAEKDAYYSNRLRMPDGTPATTALLKTLFQRPKISTIREFLIVNGIREIDLPELKPVPSQNKLSNYKQLLSELIKPNTTAKNGIQALINIL